MTKDEEEEDSVPGWDVIDNALAALYGTLEPVHYGTVVKYMMGGPDPLDGISAYPVDEPVPHWHFVSYGLTELYEKDSPNPEVSGFGFELTLRVAREEGEEEPPAFALNFLQNMARYVFDSGRPFAPGHTMDLNGPIALGRTTKITAICFAPDPDLPAIDSPHGRLEFLQIVGITSDELMAKRAWQQSSFLELLGRVLPKLITDLRRASLLEDAAVASEVWRRTAAEGSSTGAVTTNQMAVARSGLLKRKVRWTLGASEASSLGMVLPGRVPFGQPLTAMDKDLQVHLQPGSSNGFEVEDGRLTITLNAAGVRALAAVLQPRRGEHVLGELPNLTIEIVPTEIRNAEGRVVEVVG